MRIGNGSQRWLPFFRLLVMETGTWAVPLEPVPALVLYKFCDSHGDKDTAVYTRIRRLTDNGIAERILTGEDKGKYKKVVKMLV